MGSAAATDLVTTRLALHQLAEQVISPMRQRATGGRIALQARPGGFGTKDLPGGGWAGVFKLELILIQRGQDAKRAPITSLRAAGVFMDDPAAEELPADLLSIDPGAARTIAAAFDGATQALTALLSISERSEDSSEIDLWPEHFDVAITLGSQQAGARATYGVSPGDEHHPEPYAYVAPWEPRDGEGWNAVGFSGAEIPYVGVDATLAFFKARRSALGR